MNITIPHALGISVLGLCVVFLVLVILMVVIYIMTAIVRRAAATRASVTSDTEATETAASAAEIPETSAEAEYIPRVSRAPLSGPKKYRVTVNGTVYDVEDAEMGGGKAAYAPPPALHAQAAVPVKAAEVKPADKPSPPPPVSAGNEVVTSPLPGIVVSVNVKPGDTVRSGHVLLLLEAMKMENEVVAPRAGTIVSVAVTQGAAVQTGDALVTIG